jgi:hypothetical protein
VITRSESATSGKKIFKYDLCAVFHLSILFAYYEDQELDKDCHQ